MDYGDPRVDEILAEAETCARYGMQEMLAGLLPALAALPDSAARTAGRARLEELMAGAPSRQTPAPPTPYIAEPPPRATPPPQGRLAAVGAYRRAPCRPAELVGCSPAQVRAVLGHADAEEAGRVWPSDGTEAAVPHIEPGRPYFVWTYERVLEPAEPDPPESDPGPLEHGSTWLLYFFASGEPGARQPTVVVHVDAVPADIMF